MALKVGDSVVIKEGVQDVDIGGSIEGYQGRITELGEDERGVTWLSVQWDSITLKRIPRSSIEQMEEQGLDWATYYLEVEKVEPAMERDTPAQVRIVLREIAHEVSWIHLGEEGRRIQRVLTGIEVLAGMDPEGILAALKAWEPYLAGKLVFPFDAVVSEYQESGYLQAGDKISVRRMREAHELYGLVVELRRGRESYDFPLCDLEVANNQSSNYQPVKDYCIWFANR